VRRARAAFARHAADGRIQAQGEADAELGDDALTVGDVTVNWLDADACTAADYRIALDLWPSGRLVLSHLGRRFDTFAEQLRLVRNAARVAGMLAHGTAMPEVFPGALLGGAAPRPADFQVFDTHVTIVPHDGDPVQVPLGALTDLAVQEDPPAVALVTTEGRTVAGQLARKRDAFHHAVAEARAAQSTLLADLTGRRGFTDGLGLPRAAIEGFDVLLQRFTAEQRLEGARMLVGRAKGGEPRLGFVKLLDPEGDAAASPAPLPDHWASFLLVPVGPLVVLEILAGPSAATYVFAGAIDAVNRDLQALHCRRAPLALTEAQAAITPENPHRLALRRLDPLKRLRAATRARIVHNEGWAGALDKALVS
jgi:hypothetical protein